MFSGFNDWLLKHLKVQITIDFVKK